MDDPGRTGQARGEGVVPVLFVESYPQALAGQQQTLTALLARTPAAGISPVVAAPGEGVFLERLRAMGIPVEVLPQPESIGIYGGEVYRYGIARKSVMLWQTLVYVAALRRWISQSNFAAVYCNDMRGLLTFGLAARLARRPVVIWDKLDRPHGIYDWLQLPIVNRNLVIAAVVCSKYPRWQRRLYHNRIQLVRNGIDVDRFCVSGRDACRSALGLGKNAVIVAIAGTVTERKGHDLLLLAFEAARAELPDLHLAVIGEASAESGEFRSSLMALYRDHVHWLGARSDMPQLMAGIDILVSPSRHEGMGRVNVEAMAAGVPVIGAVNTGIAEVVVEGETGYLVDPADRAVLCDRILRLARDPGLRRRMGAAGRLRVEAEFNAKRQIDYALGAVREVALQ